MSWDCLCVPRGASRVPILGTTKCCKVWAFFSWNQLNRASSGRPHTHTFHHVHCPPRRRLTDHVTHPAQIHTYPSGHNVETAVRSGIMADGNVFTTASALIPGIKSPEGFIQTEPLLAVCRLVLPMIGASAFPARGPVAGACAPVGVGLNAPPAGVRCACTVHADKLGTAFALVKSDISGNIKVGADRGACCWRRACAQTLRVYVHNRATPCAVRLGGVCARCAAEAGGPSCAGPTALQPAVHHRPGRDRTGQPERRVILHQGPALAEAVRRGLAACAPSGGGGGQEGGGVSTRGQQEGRRPYIVFGWGGVTRPTACSRAASRQEGPSRNP